MQNAVRVGDLIQRRRTLGAVAPARTGVLRVAFKFLNFTGFFIDISEQSARRFTVETGRRDELVMPLFATGPGLGIKLGPIIPAFFRWERGEMDSARAGVEGVAARCRLIRFVVSHIPSHARNECSCSLRSRAETLPTVLMMKSWC